MSQCCLCVVWCQIDGEQLGKIMDLVESGKKEGAKLCTGGNKTGDKGFYMQPTVFADVQDHMRIATEEVGTHKGVLTF